MYYFYPFAIIVNPIKFLISTFYSIRIIIKPKKWKFYPHYNPLSAFTAFYYWIRALELKRHGRKGISTNLGTRKHKMSQYWFYTLPSLFAYWKAGAVTLFFSMFGWWAFHFLWLLNFDIQFEWFLSIILFSLLSTTFYRHMFICQNYNVFGWMFMPLGLFGLLSQKLDTFNIWMACCELR
jgi:hypothetical protein